MRVSVGCPNGPEKGRGRLSTPFHKYGCIRAPLHPLPLRCASSPYSTVCLSRAPCIHARLHRLATNPGEKCGLVCLVFPRYLEDPADIGQHRLLVDRLWWGGFP